MIIVRIPTRTRTLTLTLTLTRTLTLTLTLSLISDQSGEVAIRKPHPTSAAGLAEYWGKQVAVCRKGDSFGELALMSTQPRAATAVSAVGVHTLHPTP